ncbi:N-alpha-acetyltransferase 10/11 [Nematocida minor]|uniref:N-alpha-acetyltransferase 10/11 n=1 Tax=Nematocida minor TaxID=1912983 RepID=UPI002220ED86|nr:N-alpha-acetyltransferase 10/11 [Nematocida minor]KAI5190238.1 N-alpha-acetyltransferase 10/11 [Nematocida minor]
MKVRTMSISDVFHVKECNRRNLPENYHIMFLLYMITMYEECCFVAENNKGDIIGYSITKLKDHIEKDEKISTDDVSGYIMSVAVDEAYRNRGLGKILLAASLHGVVRKLRSRKIGAFKVYLNVRVSNTSAIDMYKNTFKFSEEGEDADYYSNGESALLMSRVFNSNESERTSEGKCADQMDTKDKHRV